MCQSVLASFFVRAAAGQFDLDTPDGLAGLLVRMARNKLASAARRHTSARRDVRRVATQEGSGVAAEAPSPSQQVEWRELFQRFREHLSDDERRLADARARGRPWADIAAEVGDDARALSKRLERAVDRVCGELGLADS